MSPDAAFSVNIALTSMVIVGCLIAWASESHCHDC